MATGSSKYTIIKAAAASAILIAFGAFTSGCLDGSSSSKLGDGHDFGDNDRNVVVAMGDSITTGSGNPGSPPWTARFAGMVNKTVLNRGRGGATASAGAGRINGELSRNKPGYVIIFYGANDAIQGVGANTTEAALRAMVGAAKANKTIPVLANVIHMTGGRSIFNGRVDEINARIRTIASQEGVRIANVDSAISKDPEKYLIDGLHPNDLGEELIALTFLDVFN